MQYGRSGCWIPPRSPTKTLLLGTEQGWGGWAGTHPPEYQSGGEWLGGLWGLCEAEPPPSQLGRGKRGPNAAPGNKESVWLVTALRKRGETNVPLIGGEVTSQGCCQAGGEGLPLRPGASHPHPGTMLTPQICPTASQHWCTAQI